MLSPRKCVSYAFSYVTAEFLIYSTSIVEQL